MKDSHDMQPSSFFNEVPEPEAAETFEVLEAQRGFARTLEQLATEVPEITEAQEGITTIGNELIDYLGINASFFGDRSRTLLFAAIAKHQNSLETIPEISDEAYDQGSQFTIDTTRLLAWNYARDYEALKAEWLDAGISDDQKRAAYDQFTNGPETERINSLIAEGALDQLREKLGLTPETEQPFEVRVLDIGYPSCKDEVLIANRAAFNEAIGSKRSGIGWVTEMNDVTYLILTLPEARRIRALRTSPPPQRINPTLKHEYVHTQPPNLRVHGFGRLFEESRAVIYSQDMAYREFQDFLRHLGLIASADYTTFYTFIKEAQAAQDSSVMYTRVANEVGLENTLSIAMHYGAHYASDLTPTENRALAYNGDSNAILEKVYAFIATDPNRKTALETRLHSQVEALAPTNNNNLQLAKRQLQATTKAPLIRRLLEEICDHGRLL